MRVTSPIVITFLAAACSPASTTSEQLTEIISADEVSRAVPVSSLDDIEGFWHVSRFEDYEPGWQDYSGWRNASVHIDDGRLSYAVGCNRSGNPARIEGGVLKDTGDGSRMQTLIGCGEEREARDTRFFRFFASNPAVMKVGEGKLRIANGETELILLDEARHLAENGASISEIEGRWVPQSGEEFSGWGMSGATIGDDPGILTIGKNKLEWSKCPKASVVGKYTPGHRFIRDEKSVANCSFASSPAMPTSDIVTTVMHGNPAFIRTGPDRIAMYISGKAIHLQSEQSVLNPPPPPPAPAGAPPPPPPPPPPHRRQINQAHAHQELWFDATGKTGSTNTRAILTPAIRPVHRSSLVPAVRSRGRQASR